MDSIIGLFYTLLGFILAPIVWAHQTGLLDLAAVILLFYVLGKVKAIETRLDFHIPSVRKALDELKRK